MAAPAPNTNQSAESGKDGFPTQAEDYKLEKKIGQGAFASVYLAECPKKNQKVAIKMVDLDSLNCTWEQIRNEIQTMHFLDHPNVVRSYCCFVHGATLWIVMPLLGAGSCSVIMQHYFPTGLKSNELIATILYEVLKGLDYFHKDGKIHRDVKAGNILISLDGQVQLGDFGVAGALVEGGNRQQMKKTFIGTPCWMSPEMMEQVGYDQRVDIWALGITALELAYGKPPYANQSPIKIMMLTINKPPPTPDFYGDNSFKFSSKFRNLVASCLQKDPQKRPFAKDLLKHPFFKKYAKDSSVIKKELLAKLPPNFENNIYKDIGGGLPAPGAVDHIEDPKKKPISVHSWVFPSKEELEEERKKHAAEGHHKISSIPEDALNVNPNPNPSHGRFKISDVPSSDSVNAAAKPAGATNLRVGRFEVVEENVAPTMVPATVSIAIPAAAPGAAPAVPGPIPAGVPAQPAVAVVSAQPAATEQVGRFVISSATPAKQ